MDGIVNRVAIAVLLALLGVASCGDSESPPADTGPMIHWTADTTPIALPEARNGSRDEWNHRLAQRFVISLWPDGEIYFKSWELHLLEDPQEREAAVQGLREALRSAKAWIDEEGGEEEPPLEGVMLHFDGNCTWRDAADCIHAAVAAEVPVDRLWIAVRASSEQGKRALRLALRSGESQPKRALRIQIRRNNRAATDVQVGAHSWSFPAEDEADSRAEKASRQWARIEAMIRMQQEPAAAITVEDNVGWAYVVRVLDIVLTPTRSRVVFPDGGFVISFRAK